jgi:thiol-disulfide isomerase/thioredoxin
MHRVCVVGLALFGVALQARAQNPVDPAELLQRAASAAARLSSLTYEAEFLADGALAQNASTVYGTVRVRRDDGAKALVRIDGQTLPPRATAALDFRYACDGDKAIQIDEQRRSVSVGQSVAGMSRECDMLVPTFFTLPNAFEQERQAKQLRYDGVKPSDGVDCHVLHVQYDAFGRNVAILYLGVDDLLVRRIERPRNVNTPMAGSEFFIARKLRIDESHPDTLFTLTAPPGYSVRTVGGPPPGSIEIGSPAPDWELHTFSGETVSLKSLRGKVVVLDFWASWCGPCRISMPHMQNLHDRFKDAPVAVFGVNCRERAGGVDKAKAFIKEKGYTYPQLLDADSKIATAFRVGGIPRFYVIDQEGRVLHTSAGAAPQLEQLLTQIIETAIKKNANAS